MDNRENKEPSNNKELIGTEQLIEIYENISAKAIGALRTEAVPSNETYRMVLMAQDLYNQMNAQFSNYPRSTYWGGGSSGNCL